jgi:hypothetical protein
MCIGCQPDATHSIASSFDGFRAGNIRAALPQKPVVALTFPLRLTLVSNGWEPITSIFTICIRSIQRRQSKKLSAQWPSWSEWGRCSIWACRKCRPRLFPGDTLYTLLQLCKVSTPFSCGSRRAQCCLAERAWYWLRGLQSSGQRYPYSKYHQNRGPGSG